MSQERPALRLEQPIWLRSLSKPKPTYPSLTGHRQKDVAIVGGGITGALIAHAFTTAGISVAVVEGDLVARGSTAASSALLLQEPDQGLLQLAERYGTHAARRIWQLSHEAVRDLVGLLRRLHIQCGLTKRDVIYYATQADGVERLRREFLVRKKAGFQPEWLTPGPLRRMTGIPGRGAIHSRGSAQFNPYRACLGVLRAAVMAGTEIFERSFVTRIDAGRDRVRIHTRNARIDARRVVIATGYATPHFRPLAGRFRMYRTYVLATQPLNASQRHELGLSDIMIWDTKRPYHYARWTEDHRLLLGGADRPVRVGQHRRAQFRRATRELQEDFESLLPGLATVDIPDAWEGLFAITPDSLPYIGSHRRYPGHWFALGYGGNGMTFGFLAARLLVEQWQGIHSPDHGLFGFQRTASR
jgi:glycine/D-amino acid oxidase-like deaminating enzyme